MGVQSDALNHFKQSFQILSSYLPVAGANDEQREQEEERFLDRGAIETAKSALQVACIQDDQGKYQDAFKHA